jgi:putative restriction endonuclease
MKQGSKNWSRDELVIVFNLYCRTPFGRMHKSNPEVIQLAESIGRTPSAVAMKMVNFASLDPAQQKRNIKGLSHASRQDTQIWDEFNQNWENLAFESQRAVAGFEGEPSKELIDEKVLLNSDVPTEALKSVRVRLVQRFFRDAVLSSYNFSCAICKLSLTMMLNASHIIPWSVDKIRRADPRNGLSLCAFHDRAFDKGLITVDESFQIVLSKKVQISNAPKLHKVGLLEIEGQKIKLPDKFRPEQICFAYHREKVFLQ